jgi:hypothetical protein
MTHFFTVILFLSILGAESPAYICKVLLPGISEEYIGECRRGLAHGRGTASGDDLYQGEFRRGLPHGYGKYTWSNGDVYEGPWRRGEMHGYGEFTIAESDSSYFGLWLRDDLKRIVDTTDVRVPDYTVHYRRNLTNVRFRRTGDGNKVLINFRDAGPGRRIINVSNFGSSGHEIFYTSHFGFDNTEFPFEGKISFTAPSRTGAVFYNIELHFEINRPGLWEIYLNF